MFGGGVLVILVIFLQFAQIVDTYVLDRFQEIQSRKEVKLC